MKKIIEKIDFVIVLIFCASLLLLLTAITLTLIDHIKNPDIDYDKYTEVVLNKPFFENSTIILSSVLVLLTIMIIISIRRLIMPTEKNIFTVRCLYFVFAFVLISYFKFFAL